MLTTVSTVIFYLIRK